MFRKSEAVTRLGSVAFHEKSGKSREKNLEKSRENSREKSLEKSREKSENAGKKSGETTERIQNFRETQN